MIYVGMDDSKKSIEMVVLSEEGERLAEMTIPNTISGLRKMVRLLERRFSGSEFRFGYEAGPGGFVLQRRLQKLGQECLVAAASMTPKRKGQRIKTNRRDALELARLLRGGLLVEVEPPDETAEADRELCRCRAKLRQDLTRSRLRLTHFLLRRGCVYGGSNWSQGHRRWLSQVELAEESDRQALQLYQWQVEQLEQGLALVEEQVSQLAQSDRHREVVGALRCFRGVDTVTALSFICELYSFGRFRSARGLMNFLGLVPSEESTGEGTTRGGITKTGNRYVRRLLVESAHHYRHRPAVGQALRKRRQGQPAEAIAHADKAMLRLHRKFVRLTWRGKASNKITVALARELSGFLWAVTNQVCDQQQDAVA